MEKDSTTKKTFKLGLVPRLLIAITVGVLLGSFAPEGINRFVITLSTLFGTFLMFIIPLMILAFVTMGIADLTQGAGKLLGITAGIAYVFTLIAGTTAYLVASNLFPAFLDPTAMGAVGDPEAGMLSPFFRIVIPPIIDVMGALVMAFILGLCISAMRSRGNGAGNTLHAFFSEFSQVIVMVLHKVIIPLLPVFICGTFVNLTVSGVAFTILSVLWKVFLTVIALHLTYLLVVFLISGFISKKNPFTMMKNQIPGYLSAIGTQSSAATIPINLVCAERNGVSKEIRNFVIPFCANINLPGSMITLISCVTAILLMSGMPHSIGLMVPFILTLSMVMVAAPGAPGGAIMAALPFMALVGISPEGAMASLLLALYITQDGFGTACNVSGDNAIAAAMDTFYQIHLKG
jgi:Na+/H+-dicarboxylate symporter